MTLQQLKYIVTVAETGTITEAANRLYISQPSLTNAIRELEKEMNIVIFNRTNKGISLSKEGYLKKIVSEENGRIMYITITDAGEELSEKYNRQFFGSLSESLGDISDADCTIRTIEKIYEIMCERKGRFE